MKVFSTWSLPDSARKLLQSNNLLVEEYSTGNLITPEELYEANRNIDAMITLLTDTVDARVLKRNISLKIVANVAVGYNNIDVDTASELNIVVSNTPDILTDATADLAVALILSTVRRIAEADVFVKKKKFTGWRPDLFLGSGFKGKKLGIFGMGKIGQAVARRMRPFGCEIIYNNRKPVDKEIEKSLSADFVDFDTLLTSSDYLCVLAPLTNETKGRFGKNEFSSMKKDAYFFNIARGQIMDEKALLEAIKSGHLSGAGLDVYENEPLIEPELLNMENVVLLPHIGSADEKTREEMFLLAARNVVNILHGKEAITPVN